MIVVQARLESVYLIAKKFDHWQQDAYEKRDGHISRYGHVRDERYEFGVIRADQRDAAYGKTYVGEIRQESANTRQKLARDYSRVLREYWDVSWRTVDAIKSLTFVEPAEKVQTQDEHVEEGNQTHVGIMFCFHVFLAFLDGKSIDNE